MKVLLLFFLTLTFLELQAQESTDTLSYQVSLTGITLAVQNMSDMKRFYEKVFHVEFVEIEMYGGILYEGDFAGLKLLLCPAEIAGNTAEQNRHQLEILVSDLKKTMLMLKENGGEITGSIFEVQGFNTVAAKDPDENTIVLKQSISN